MPGYRTDVIPTKSRAQRGWRGSSVRGRVQPVSPRDVVHPDGRPVGQPVLVGQFAELGQLVQRLADRVVGVLEEQLTEFAEIVLETTRRDDLDDAARLGAGVPCRAAGGRWRCGPSC